MRDFEPIELLHRGHAYDVWDAWSRSRGCRVVLRTARERRHRRALLREGRLLRRLAHPHLVRAYEVRRRPPMVVLETLGGATLAALLEDGPLEEEDAIELGLQLASAVRYLHRHGVLHLDLKPSDLIADAGRLKVIDLSIAQPPGRIAPGVGTEGWMAPEQETGGRVGPAADVWGMGAVLRAAGAPARVFEPCLRRDPGDRPSVDRVIHELRACKEAGPTAPVYRPA